MASALKLLPLWAWVLKQPKTFSKMVFFNTTLSVMENMRARELSLCEL